MLKNRIIQCCLFLVTFIAAVSCTKDPDLLGLDLLPPDDHLSIDYFDTSTLVAYTVREASLRTDELTLNLLGSISDPVFGTTTASIYTQYSTSKNDITFAANSVADSMVLTFVYKGFYGDSLAPKTIKVYELADTLDYTSIYYSNKVKPYLPELIGEATFVPNFRRADSIDGDSISPHMRVMLSQAFMNKIITADANTLKNNENFQQVFKGLFITPEPTSTPGTGSMLYLNLEHAYSRLKLYYHVPADTGNVLSEMEFLLGSGNARYNFYEHDYNDADPQLNQQISGDTTSGSQKLFIQSMAGTKVNLRIPYIKALSEKKRIAINEALLVIKVDDTTGTYKVPAQLAIRIINGDGTYTALPDEEIGTSFIDGKSRDGKEYQFRITRYLQDRLLNPDAPDYGVELYGVGSSISSNRVILKGTDISEGKMKLLVYYTLVD